MQKNNKGNSNAPQDAIKEYTANILIVDFIDCICVKNPRTTALSIISKKNTLMIQYYHDLTQWFLSLLSNPH